MSPTRGYFNNPIYAAFCFCSSFRLAGMTVNNLDLRANNHFGELFQQPPEVAPAL